MTWSHYPLQNTQTQKIYKDDYEVSYLKEYSTSVSLSCDQILGSDAQDADSDEEWPALGAAGAVDGDVECDTEVVVDPDDEKAIEMFMNKNPPMRQVATSPRPYLESSPRDWF